MEKEHREDFALAPAMEPAGNNGDREPRRRRQQRAASQSESREADDQRLALHDRMLAAMQAGDVRSLLADGPSSATQMNKEEFLAQLRLAVEAAANQELGRLGSAAGCPYIESYFGKYGQQPAAAAELLLRRWVPNATGAASARDLIPLVVARVRTGVHEWTKTGALPADLSAADPQVAALAPVAQAAQVQSTQAAVGNEAAAPTSLHAMEAELGSGQALDGATAARVGAGGAAGDVKIHTGPVAAAKAAQHNAVAFAVGNNVVMGAGAPAPGTLLGDALLAHELAHTAQQRDAARDPQARKRAIGGEDVAAEHDADRAAAQGLATAGKDPALAGLAAVGDRFGDVMKTGLQLQRCQVADANASIDRAAYYQTYKLQIAQTAADHLRTLPFRIAEPTVKWVSAPELFSQVIAEGVLKSDIDALVRPEAIGSLIDSSRLMDTLNLGPDAPAGASVGLQVSTGPNKYFGAVGIEVGNALARRTNESLLREVPRYAEAVSRLESAQAKPHADDIAVSHPMDPIVISALLATKLAVDVAAFKRAHPASATAFAPAAKTSRNIVWEPAAEKGAGSQWRRVIEPIDVTEEELAAAWLGSPTEAFRIVSAYPLYGIRPDRRGQLRNTQADNASGDPVEGLLAEGGAVADEVMLAQAATVGADSGQRATGRPAIVVLEQMHHNVQSLKTSVVEAAKRFGLHSQLATVTARLDARVQRIAALAPLEQEIELRRWDLQTAMQAEVIRRATNGLFADGERLRIYADGFKVDLAKDAGAHGLPYEYRQILREDAEAWVGVVDVSDVAGVAEQRLAQASAHFATLDIWLLERSLGTAQYAADASGGAQQTQADFAAGTLAPRELALRGELGVMRQTMMAGQLSGAQSDKTAQAVEDLTFESQMVLQAVQLEGAWTTLENLEGFLSRVTLQQGDLEHFASRGKKYYQRWRGIRDTFNNGVKNNDAALKQKARADFQQLAGSFEFQDFFSDVRAQLVHTQKVHLIASLVAMVAITVVSMGAGTIVSGALGGTRVAIVAATAGEAATATQVVATGLGVSRTVASVAGFVTEAAVFTGLSTAVFEKDPSIGGVITSFGKNLVMFGGMRGLARVFESLGLLGNAAKLGADASKGTKVLTHSVDALAETVLMGGVGVLLTAVEAEVKAKLNGRPVTSDEYEQMLISTLLQTIAMVIVARAGAPMLAKLQSSAALGATRLRIKAHTEQTLAHAQYVQGLRDGGKLTAETVTAAATRDRILMEEELALAQEVLQSAKHDPAAVDAALQKAGLSRAELQQHIDGVTAQLPTVRGMEVMFRLRELGPGELGCPRAQVHDVLAAQRALSSEAPVLEATNPATGARTWRCARAKPAQTSPANIDTTPVRITELMPAWALDATGQRLVHAAEASGLGETIFGLSEPAISALRDADGALLRGDSAGATAAFERSGIAAKERAALEVKVREQLGAQGNTLSTARLKEVRQGQPGVIRNETALSNNDVAISMNEQLKNIGVADIDHVLGSFSLSEQAQARYVLSRASQFGSLESFNPLRVAMEPYVAANRKLFMPGSGSLADNVAYSSSKGSFDSVPGASHKHVATTSVLEPRSIVILDDVVLARVKSDPAFAKSLVDNDCIILEPHGFNSGMNMFNTESPAKVQARTTQILGRAKEVQAGSAGNLTFEGAVDVALQESARTILAAANPALIGQLTVVQGAEHPAIASSAIAAQLNGGAGITGEQLGKVLDGAGLSPEQQNTLREMLAQRAEIFSARRFAIELQQMNGKMMDSASAQGVTPDKVYFYIPQSGKSYGMLAMAHRQMTGTPVARYINGPAELATRKLGADTMIVIFDDVAGSGDSLNQAQTAVKRVGFSGKIAVAPMVSTEVAASLFRGISANNPNVSFQPNNMSQALKESAFFKGLSPEQQSILQEYVGNDGYKDNALSMAFPYMAPDNNNAFFGDLIAKFYIANQNHSASKSAPYKPKSK